jgi:hypothetical protein
MGWSRKKIMIICSPVQKELKWRVFTKDAGFVYESFRNESNLLRFLVLRNESTKRIFWTPLYETNPRNESFEHRTTKRIHETNLLNTVGIRESGPQDSYGFVVCLCSKDSWGFVGFVGFVKKGRILSKTVYETNPRYGYLKTLVTNRNETNPKIRIRFVGTKRIFLSQDSWSTIRYESTDSRNESMFLRISYTNPASLVFTQHE